MFPEFILYINVDEVKAKPTPQFLLRKGERHKRQQEELVRVGLQARHSDLGSTAV